MRLAVEWAGESIQTGADMQDSVTGLLLAGIGNVDAQQKKNFLIVDGSESAHTMLMIDTRAGTDRLSIHEQANASRNTNQRD